MKTYFLPDPKPIKKIKPKKALKSKRKKTGEAKLFEEIYIDRLGKCRITGEQLPLSPICFMHILSKGGYPRYRLNPKNILLVLPEIHTLYDCGSMEYLISLYPNAKMIYDLKDELRTEYYKKETI
jgi:hypothetical protein